MTDVNASTTEQQRLVLRKMLRVSRNALMQGVDSHLFANVFEKFLVFFDGHLISQKSHICLTFVSYETNVK
jgi:hypothetical protein